MDRAPVGRQRIVSAEQRGLGAGPVRSGVGIAAVGGVDPQFVRDAERGKIGQARGVVGGQQLERHGQARGADAAVGSHRELGRASIGVREIGQIVARRVADHHDVVRAGHKDSVAGQVVQRGGAPVIEPDGAEEETGGGERGPEGEDAEAFVRRGGQRTAGADPGAGELVLGIGEVEGEVDAGQGVGPKEDVLAQDAELGDGGGVLEVGGGRDSNGPGLGDALDNDAVIAGHEVGGGNAGDGLQSDGWARVEVL